MRVDHQRVATYSQSRLVRAAVQGIFAVLVLGFSSFWTLFGTVAMFLDESQYKYPVLNGVLIIGFGGLFPGALGVLLVWLSFLNFRRSNRMRRFVAVISCGSVRDTNHLASAIGISPDQAHTVAYDALSSGIVDQEGFATIVGTSAFADQTRRAHALAAAEQPATAQTVVDPHAAQLAPAPRGPAMAPKAWIGRTLKGTWQVEALLGAGGMGAVFRTLHLRTGRRYALKVILPEAGQSRDMLRRFEREATAASTLGHPGIIAVHDFDWTEEGAAYLVMDLLEGETLLQRLERHGALPWRIARPIALELGDALATAHGIGLLHRDVKPANVFLAREAQRERAVLLDFGLVKRMNASPASRVTSTGVVVGTPLYMSPEQARGAPLDARSDLYGLAVVIYEMVVGVPPFFGRSEAELYARLMREEAPHASSVGACPRGLDEVLAHALAHSPDARYADVRSFLAAVASVQS